ncbi:MAG: hypothetical protein JSR82_11450 [Verrucomicrobia bacterium]|nr:hypothetical protein [Verrucomicrobiota bacterium]
MNAPPHSIALETFPRDEETRAALYWMGDDYGTRLARDLSRQLAEDDPHGRMLRLKCVGWPKLEIESRETDERVLGVRAEFQLQALMQAGDGSHWRLAIRSIYTATDLEREDGGSFGAESEVLSAEPAP